MDYSEGVKTEKYYRPSMPPRVVVDVFLQTLLSINRNGKIQFHLGYVITYLDLHQM